MKKRSLIFSLMIFINFMLIFVINTGKVYGYVHDVDSLSNVSVDTALGYDWKGDDKEKIDHISTHCDRIWYEREECMHVLSSETGKDTVSDSWNNLTLKAILDIYPDGSARIQYKKGGEIKEETLPPNIKNKKAAYIARWATLAQDGKISGYASASEPKKARKSSGSSFGYLFFKDGYDSYIKEATDGVVAWKKTPYHDWRETHISSYYDSWPKDSDELNKSSIRARLMFYFGTAGCQDRIFCWGKDEEGPLVSIDKYIVKVNGEGLSEGLSDRAGKDGVKGADGGAWKKENPGITETSDSTVTYKVILKNTGEAPIRGVFKEAFDNRYFEQHIRLQYTFNGTEHDIDADESRDKVIVDPTNSHAYCYETTEFTLNPGVTVEYTITLWGKDKSKGKYENRATFTPKDDKYNPISSSDWVEISIPLEKPVMEKFVKKVGKVFIEPDRYGTEEDWKEENKVDVDKDDTIRYKVKITNDNDTAIIGTFTDTPDDGIIIDQIATGSELQVEIDNGTKDNVRIPANFTRTITIDAHLDEKITPNKAYENKAKFVCELEGEEITLTSSDWIYVNNPPEFEIDKFITEVHSLYEGSTEEDNLYLYDGEEYEYDDDGNIIYNYEYQYDEYGNLVYDEDGNPVIINETPVIYQVPIRENKGETWKEDNVVFSYLDAVVVYYKVMVKNTGDKDFIGKLTDVCDEGMEIIYSDNNFGLENYTDEVYIASGSSIAYTFKIKLQGEKGKTYENKATFEVLAPGGADPNPQSSSDWIKIDTPPPPPDINKSITNIGVNPPYAREDMSEDEKSIDPAITGELGEDEASRKIVYKVVLENNYDYEITGKFEDFADDEIIINKILILNENNETEISSGSNVTISGGGSTEITIEGTISTTAEYYVAYKNTAKFTLISNSKFVIESSDYFIITYDSGFSGELKKYISNIEETDGKFKPDRENMDKTEKKNNPGEVEKGSIVEFTIEAKSTVLYKNWSGTDHNGNTCTEHFGKEDNYTLSCVDYYDDTLLEFVDCSGDGVEFNSETGQLTWTDVEPAEDEDTPTIVTAKLRFKVLATNMRLPSIVNTVKDLNYKYQVYNCYLAHGTYVTHYSVTMGPYETCTHDSCSFVHKEYEHTGDLGAEEDEDYVRLLDPVISGTVFLDKNGNDLMDDDEQIKDMECDQYKKIKVELWKKNDDTEDELITTVDVDEDTGEYTFGRVRKGTTRVIADPPSESGDDVPEWFEIGVGNYFYYADDAELYHYYLVFNYDGERFTVVDNHSDSHLDPTTHAIIDDYLQDSNGEEIGREEFNKALETIANDKAYKGTTSSAIKNVMEYTTKDDEGNDTHNLQISKALWDGDINSFLNITAKTFEVYYDDGETEYLQSINLGLKERDKANISLTKDLVNAEVTVNGYKTIYTYEKLGVEGETVYVKKDDNTLDTPYPLRIYREDYEYRTNNQPSEVKSILNENNPYTSFERDNDLQVLLTFKITVKNESTYSGAVIREIVDYYSNELTPKSATVNDIPLEESDSSKFENSAVTLSDSEKVFYTGTALDGVKLKPDEELTIETLFLVKKDDNGYLMLDPVEGTIFDGKYNIAEVGAYSFYELDESGEVSTTPAGLVDINSNPANVKLDGEGNIDTSKFEDDTFGTGVLVQLRDGGRRTR